MEIAFRLVGLDWREYVVSDKGLCRPTDLAVSRGNPAKAMEKLGWVAKHKIADIVRLTILHRRGYANDNDRGTISNDRVLLFRSNSKRLK